jgi:hypothetical protein
VRQKNKTPVLPNPPINIDNPQSNLFFLLRAYRRYGINPTFRALTTTGIHARRTEVTLQPVFGDYF